LPPHVERDHRVMGWEVDQLKVVVQDHQDRLDSPAKATPSPMPGLLGLLPPGLLGPAAVIILAIAVIKDPMAVLSLLSKFLVL
jgi:hypothetical protein